MKIKCSQCFFENLEGSEFCQNCGYKLSFKVAQETVDKDTQEIKKSIDEEIEKIEDVIFKPKKQKNKLLDLILLMITALFIFFGFLMITALLVRSNN